MEPHEMVYQERETRGVWWRTLIGRRRLGFLTRARRRVMGWSRGEVKALRWARRAFEDAGWGRNE